MVGERHREAALRPTLALLESFRPDAVAIESRRAYLSAEEHAMLAQLRALPEFPIEAAPWSIPSSPMYTAAAYAAKARIPLYLAEWMPAAPQARDYFHGGEPEAEWPGLLHSLESTIETLFGKDGMFDAECAIGESLLLFAGSGKDVMDQMRYSLLCLSPQGMALRNEYHAMALNAIPEERALYVGGGAHFELAHYFGELGLRAPEFISPLHHLVQAPERSYLSMDALLAGAQPQRVAETAQVVLPWHLLPYMAAL